MSDIYYFASGTKVYSSTGFGTPTVLYENTYQIRGFAYANGIFVLTDFNTMVLKSTTNFVSWDTKSLGSQQWYDVIQYLNGVWFARSSDVGVNYLTSNNAINWTQVTTSPVLSIEYFNGHWYFGIKQFSAPYSSSLYRSATPTSIGSGFVADGQYQGVPYSIATDGTNIAVSGFDYRSSNFAFVNYAYSTDASAYSWTLRADMDNNYSLKYVGNVWVMWKSCSSTSILVSTSVSFASYSTINYSSVFGGKNIYQVNYVNNHYVIIPNGGTTIAVTQNSSLAVNTLTLYNMGVSFGFSGIGSAPFGGSASNSVAPSVKNIFFASKFIGSVPSIISAYGALNGLKIYFTPSTNGYPSPSAYYYTVSGDIYDGSTHYLANGTSSPLTITGLNTVGSYTVRLMAQNDVGNTALSSPATGSPYIIPAEGPTITQITVSASNQLTVAFTPPAGSYYPTYLTYQYSLDGGSFASSGSSTSPIVVQGLAINKIYGVVLTAVASDASGNAWTSPQSSPFSIPCFLQGTKILRFNISDCKDEYVPVETLRQGDLIKTSQSGYRAIYCIGHRTIYNPPLSVDTANRIYCYKRGPKCPELSEDLYVTGNHCALLYDVPDETLEKVREYMGKIYVTEGDYRVPACLDDRAVPLDEEGEMTIWHFALENDCIYSNYGVYANGLLVESSSIRYMREFSGMDLDKGGI